jgi:hypothetical protein
MPIFSIGPVDNKPDTGGFRSSKVVLRVGNPAGGAPVGGIVVNAYDSPGAAAGVGGAPATLYFTTTFQIDEVNGVVKLTIPTTVDSFIIRVSSPGTTVDNIEIYAQGIDAFGNFVPEHSFPFGDWGSVNAV